ncbi:MAG: SusC/RagA family TonB-linked outer membrane protein [Gemmatimonadetes bacterium]|nr:SusC/RagA family TonB-linked outer membrane protein [Gemmatimonadota bacterium]
MKWRIVILTMAFVVASAIRANAQTRIVTGRVVDSLTNEPLSSGQVVLPGTTIRTLVKDDGTFTMVVPARDVTLTIRSIGFKRLDVTVPASQNAVQAALERDYFQLEAIVVTGQATGVERRNLANAVSTVTADQLVKTAVTSVDQALVGKLAGAQIYGNTAAPGGGMQVKVRSGFNSVLGNSMPLWIVDGVIVNNQEIGNGLNQVTRGGSQSCNASGAQCGAQDQTLNRVSDINPNDIENVEVLKGAAAAAIYGSKANNGVILVTTKRGRAGAPQFGLIQRLGVSSIQRRRGPYRNPASAAEAASLFGTKANDGLGNDDWAPTYYDHELEIFGNKPLSYETVGSVSGGTETTRYFASGLVKRDGGIQGRTFYDKQSVRLNVDQQVGSRLNFGISVNPVHTKRAPGLNNNDNFEVSMGMVLPVTPPWMDMRQQPDGSWPDNPYANSNPLETSAVVTAEEDVWRMINSARMDFTAVNSANHTLKIAATGGTDWYTFKGFVYSPVTSQFEPLDQFPGTVVDTRNIVGQLNVTGSLVHTFKPTNGSFSATTSVGASYETRNFNFTQVFSRNLTSGVANVSDAIDRTPAQTRSRVRDAGYYAQEEVLTLRDKLLLTAGIRADQSSTNSDASQLFFYPKFSGSYRFNLVRGWLDDIKVRAAYGQTGNQPQYGDKFNALGTGSYGGIATISTGATLIAPLHPERQAELEGGVDATVLGGRTNVEFTVYQRTISDLLINRSLIPSTGFGTARFNGATIRTRGLEAALTLVPVQSGSIQWQARTTFSRDGTRITSLPVPPYLAAGSYNRGAVRFVQDSSATDVWGNDTLPGCHAAWAAAVAAGGAGSCPIVQRKIGNLNPKFTMGFSNDLKWKSLAFSFLLNWQQGGMVSNLTMTDMDASQITYDYADPCTGGSCLPNETVGQQRYRLGRASLTKIYAQDATYLKLRQATLSLDLPKSITSRLWSGARFIRLSLSGNNLLMFTPYSGVDPEVQDRGSQNIRIGFDDIGPYPPARIFWFTVDLGF